MKCSFGSETCRWLLSFAKSILDLPRYLPLIFRTKMAAHSLVRLNENALISDQTDQVANYDQVMGSKLAVFYAVGLKALYRMRNFEGCKALDLAPGPGHFSICMQSHLNLASVKGIDLSSPMIQTANNNAAKNGISDKVKFTQGDVTSIKNEEDSQYDLVTMTFAAHHLPNLQMLRSAIEEMERLTKPDGLIMIMDLSRLPTKELTEDFVKLAGKSYKKQGLDYFYKDFYESMFAAWTTDEMKDAVENAGKRHWLQCSMHGLKTLQILFGLPNGWDLSGPVYSRKSSPWSAKNHLLSPELRPEWYLAEILMAIGEKRIISPKNG